MWRKPPGDIKSELEASTIILKKKRQDAEIKLQSVNKNEEQTATTTGTKNVNAQLHITWFDGAG